MSVFTKHLAATGMPDAVLAPAREALESAHSLTLDLNEKISQVNAAKESDPNNVEYLDTIWNNKADSGDKAFAAKAKKFAEISAQYETLQSELREMAKAEVKPALSEDETKALRQEINASRDTVMKSRESAKGMSAMLDAMLEQAGKPVENGIASLLPDPLSLKGARGGRKSSGGAAYATRANEITIDGETTNKMVNGKFKGTFEFAADALSKKFNASEHPENSVTKDELEQSYYESRGKGFREDKDNPPAEHAWEFTKDVFKNDGKGGKVSAPVTVKVKHFRWTPEGVAIPASEIVEPK